MRARSLLLFAAPLVFASMAQACHVDENITPLTTSSSATTGGGGGGTGGAPNLDGPFLDGACDPLVPTQCGYPFPSNVYRAVDASTKTGHRVAFPKVALPAISGAGHVDPAPFNKADGFSAGQAPLTDLPGATVTGLPDQNHVADSLLPTSPTILLNADTGELVPHFAEIDMSSAASDGDRAFMIRPVVRLADNTRYIVAIRHVVDKSGSAIEPSPAFKALRDGTTSDEKSVDMRRGLYKDIFAKLDTAGVKKDDLQIAWDYSTASRESNTAWLVHMRDDALATVGADGPAYTIDSVEDAPNQYIAKRIHGTMTVPLYLDKPGPGGRLVFGADGLPKQNGTAQYPFLVHVPNSAYTSGPYAVVQNGHGLLGDKTEGQNGYLAQICEDNHFIAVAVDLVGMAEEDQPVVEGAIGGDIGNFQIAVDRQHQGILNSLLAMRMMKGGFAKDPLMQVGGKSMIDSDHVYYRGDSQGGIFGATYMALSTDVTRGLLGEPGMPYGLLLNRSADFDPFFSVIQIFYGSGRNIQTTLGLVQMLWDRTEPNGYAPYINQNMLPGTPQHEILIHTAIGDHQVTPLGAHIIARAVQARNVDPANRVVWGVPTTKPPISDGSMMTEFSFGLYDAPLTNIPPGPETDDKRTHDPHDWVRELKEARDQSEQFLRTGTANSACGAMSCVFPPQ